MMLRWQLPDAIQDVLPPEALWLERMRRRLLDFFHLHGYEFVMPPLVEYIESLTTGVGRDLAQRTVRFQDPLSARMLGVRADMTPQMTRIDAQLLNRDGVSRLCYCASLLHAMPATLTAPREPIQLGAELFGHSGIEADVEVIRLLADTLAEAGLAEVRIDISHMGLFRALAQQAGVTAEKSEILFGLLQDKDTAGLHEFAATLPAEGRAALLALPGLYGELPQVLQRAQALLPVQNDEVRVALEQMQTLASRLPDLKLSADLADLRGYHYHCGIMFAAYVDGAAAAIALGGRYDEVGSAFGRGRAATGFSLDIRQLLLLRQHETEMRGAILAPEGEGEGLQEAIRALRDDGHIVLIELPGHAPQSWREEAGCDRELVFRAGKWCVQPLDRKQ